MAKKILVVDDDIYTVKYLESVFGDNGYQTCAAFDGTEALEMLKKEKPDLMTLDLDMPQGAGPRVYREMTKNDEIPDVPVIVISGLSRPHQSIKKAVAVVGKPFDVGELLSIVRKAIGQGNAPS